MGKYKSLNENHNNNDGQSSKYGKRVMLPSSYVGSRRYMDQLYFDGITISSVVGFPDLFITFTCNLNWPEIQRFGGPKHLKPHDCPDIITRVFKLKFDQLLKDLTKNHILGKVIACKFYELLFITKYCIHIMSSYRNESYLFFFTDMYTIEFQKRGLPYAYILNFLHSSSKYPTPVDINKIISAEIPRPNKHPELYRLVGTHMMHDPCGLANKKSPCMKNDYCSKFYPKKFMNTILLIMTDILFLEEGIMELKFKKMESP